MGARPDPTAPWGAPRTRRALLAAAVGAAAASVASALGRPAPVRAEGEAIVVGGEYTTATSVTGITNTTTDDTVISVVSNHAGIGVYGRSLSGWGVNGESHLGIGVWGGSSGSGTGVLGLSASKTGVFGQSASATGVQGYSGPLPAPVAPAKTGAFGYAAQDATARGVVGGTTAGQGVRGEATTGTGVIGTATTGTAGRFESATGATALQTVNGRVVVGDRSGRVRITAGKSSYDVTVPGGLAGTPLCFANLMNYRSGVHVAAVRPNYPSSGRLRIYLSKTLTTAAYVSWLVLG